MGTLGRYRGPVVLRELLEVSLPRDPRRPPYPQKIQPMVTLEDELREIRARHRRLSEYNRVANAIKRERYRKLALGTNAPLTSREPTYAIYCNELDEPHD